MASLKWQVKIVTFITPAEIQGIGTHAITQIRMVTNAHFLFWVTVPIQG